MAARYNKSEIMKFAWKTFKANKSLNFSDCLKKAWFLGKTNPKSLTENNLTFEQIYKSEKGWVKNYINQRINNLTESEDLTNDIFIKVSNHLDSFNSDKSKLKTWLFNITKNTIIDYLRKKTIKVTIVNEYDVNKTDITYKLRKEIKSIEDYKNSDGENTFQEPINETADQSIYEAELNLLIQKVLGNYIDNQKKVCQLHIQGYKTEEIVKELEIPEGTIKVYVHRFRKDAKSKLEKVCK